MYCFIGLAPGVNIFGVAFGPDPKRANETDSLTVFFALLGSSRIKAAPKMLVKSTLRSYLKVTLPPPSSIDSFRSLTGRQEGVKGFTKG